MSSIKLFKLFMNECYENFSKLELVSLSFDKKYSNAL